MQTAAPKATFISTEAYDTFKKSVLSGDVFKQSVLFAELKIENVDELSIRGKSLKMTENAFFQLCKILGINSQAKSSLVSSIGKAPTAQLVDIIRLVQTAKNKNQLGMIVCKSRGEVTGFGSTRQPLPGSMFIRSLEEIMNKNPDMKIVGARHESDGLIRVNALNPKWAFDVAKIENEAFHSGMSYTSFDGGCSLAHYLCRLFCQNGMALRGAEESLICNNPDNMSQFLRMVSRWDGFTTTKFEQRVEAFMKLAASVREMKEAAAMLKKALGPGSGEEVNEHVPFIDLKTDAKENLGIRNIYKMPEEFLTKMNSNMNYWELVNAITYIASHMIRDDKERDTLMTYAGNMIINNPDAYMPVRQIYPTIINQN